jgi:pyruvate kinase
MRCSIAASTCFRLNFSHGTPADHRKRMAAIRAVEAKAGRPIGVLMDLQGPKLRVGTFARGPVTLEEGKTLRLDLDPAPGKRKRVCLPHPEFSRPEARPAACSSMTASCASRSSTAATATR